MAVNELADLIVKVQDEFLHAHGVPLTFGDIARRSGGRLLRNRVQQLTANPMKALPQPETITGLALGLAVPERVVLRRALLSAGYRVPKDWIGDTSDATPMTPRTTEADAEAEERRRSIASIEATNRARGATNGRT